MDHEAALADYQRFDFDDGRWTRPVYRRGAGPAVIVMHEMPGLHPGVIRFADRVAAAGMTVFCPSLFGEPARPITPNYGVKVMLGAICVRREFHVWATDKSSPIVDWLRALARQAHAECGGKGVGAVGMCFTGGFALAMMTEPAVVAPVLSQPSLPIPFGLGRGKRLAAVDASPAEIACAQARFKDERLSMLGLRFKDDPLVPDERFATYRRTFGESFKPIELDPKDARPGGPKDPHSVLTVNLREEGPTKAAEQEVIAFLGQATRA